MEIFIDIPELQASITSLILGFGCINNILVMCVLRTLQMQHHAFTFHLRERGIKDIIIVIDYDYNYRVLILV
jgi:hypothetical protein